MKNVFFALSLSALLFASCDYVEVPQQAGGTPVTPTSDTIRKVFIEDFTGHTCPNCPKAARKLDSLELAYPDQIITMAVHTEFYAIPCTAANIPIGAIPGTFTEDFRVPAEDAEYNSIFGTSLWPFPSFLVNRYGYPDPNYIPTNVGSQSSALTATILNQPMTAYLKVTPTYNTSSRVLTVAVAGEFMVDTSGIYNIALYLTEDSLTGSQSDNTLPTPEIDNNYVFNHVFRGCINSPSSIIGATVISGAITAHTGISYSTSSLPTFTLNSSFNAAHCNVIAILYKTSDYGVLQAAEAKLIP